ncbi:MAG: c-type cytochrome [Candidatus Paceibacterota bacterium]
MKFNLYGSFLICFLFISSCINNVEDLTLSDDDPLPPQKEISYASDIQPIFNSNCTGCHGGTSGVTLSSYNSTMNSVGNRYGTEIVVPGNPGESPLVDKIEPNPEFGSRMPNGSGLTNEEISKIKAWIQDGAKDN